MEQEQRKFRRIVIDFVDHESQRYDTVGDYPPNQTMDSLREYPPAEPITYFLISKLDHFRSHAVLLHELEEKFENIRTGVTDEQIDEFDKEFNRRENFGPINMYPEPGLDPDNPAHVGHMKADVIERMHILNMEDDWIDYEAEIEELPDVECKL